VSGMRYYIHTFGCQMNVADSERLASALEKLGYQMAERPEQADVLVVNTCVVRRSAEEKAYGWLHMVRPLKERRPDRVVAVMGCLVGVKGNEGLRRAFPWVDIFMPPADPRPLVEFLARRVDEGRAVEDLERMVRYALQDEELVLPLSERGRKVTAYVPVVHGCSFGCTFCIIPYRRGPERSRPVGQIVAEVRALAEQGVREVTLLGQIVDRYGKDIPDGPDLADLLRAVHEVEGIQRIRFLTSHPSFMTDRIIEAVAELPKVCEHIEIPVQAGNDEVLARMRRGYTVADYKRVVEKIRRRIPNASIATDIIVGFCGETEEQFMDTYRLVEELEFDVVHIAKYSPRPGTVAWRTMADDVPPEEKERRFRMLEELYERISRRKNEALIGQTVEILVEDRNEKGKWFGRTRNNKLVFFEDGDRDWRGQLVSVRITAAGPWSLQGVPVEPSLEPGRSPR
jgi:tRNA-2-methylthio-N6-dimethylallyladenosine synthase